MSRLSEIGQGVYDQCTPGSRVHGRAVTSKKFQRSNTKLAASDRNQTTRKTSPTQLFHGQRRPTSKETRRARSFDNGIKTYAGTEVRRMGYFMELELRREGPERQDGTEEGT